MPQVHQYWMAEALRQARKGLYSDATQSQRGLRDSGRRCHARERLAWLYAGGPHAEINALQSADVPPGADIYVTLEPCSHHGRTPPCVDALIEAKPARVIVAMQDPNPEVCGQGLEQLRMQGIEVVVGVLAEQARELNRGFVKRMQQQLPFVSIKMACSLDGRSALSNGSSQWITSAAARRDVQFLRARASAILSSAQTVLNDDPSLNLRLSKNDLKQIFEVRQPVRVLVDSRLRLSGSEKLFSLPGEIWIYTTSNDADRHERLGARGATVIQVDSDPSGQVRPCRHDARPGSAWRQRGAYRVRPAPGRCSAAAAAGGSTGVVPGAAPAR